MKNFVEELKWRGMVHDIMPGTEELLNKGITAGYIGFDPTASSLTVGNLVQVMILVHFQNAGHKPVALVGGATGMIGDPSGKSEERKLLSEETLTHNQNCVKKQLTKFLSFTGENAAEVVNNYDWFKDFSFIGFLRDVGKHLTVNYMMSKESVKKRLETGISFTEFSYQLLQGYDYLHLYKNKNCRLQMGGSDQWGNITAGTELVRRMEGGEAFALTTPLLTKADGTKFGKSEGGNIWLDPSMTSPYKFYQFWLNSADDDAKKFIRIFTLKTKEDIEALEKEHETAPHMRILQKALAEEITTRVHSKEDYITAVKASEILFGKSTTEDLESLDEDTLLSVFEGVPQVEITKDLLAETPTITDLLSVATGNVIFTSKGEARKMITGGGVSINKIKIESEQRIDYKLLQDKYLLVQKGKKNYFLLKVN
ncbi:tyrosyl-tRNA synthetase [Sporocytophaga myxococcoides]|uniref:Tyrosine--tRNA ligase n=1 Tax=Sporocytophaga myxococcoides TaxID=153721 RepID=A0A098LBC2_9BACT|nr:tyrosine--tRNA ligase [Sporocytophaga myxococcoides]GAL83538.1 tyrosyl-tRNA synthetase [Sporocytophaga myxococcoides]